MRTASPGWSWTFCRCSACCRSWRSDLVGVAEHVHALERGHVDQHAAGHQGADLLDAELGEAGPGGDLVGLEAVVVAVLDRLMREAVELGADLPDLADDELLVAAAPVRGQVHERCA